jgi:putative SOS response-associated peptidase YedK
MCARYSAAKDLVEFARFFNFVCRVAFFAPRYNIAPRQKPLSLSSTISSQS